MADSAGNIHVYGRLSTYSVSFCDKLVKYYLPSLSSPKFPQPIFLPTRKLGPTIRTPEDEVTECLDVCIALLPPTPRPPTAPVALQQCTHSFRSCTIVELTKIIIKNNLYNFFGQWEEGDMGHLS